MQNRTVPNPTAATPASTHRPHGQTRRWISGPLASTVPSTATPMPTQAIDAGLVPGGHAEQHGHGRAQRGRDGATTLIVPVDSAA